MKPGEFPTQDKCNPKNPREFAAWTLVALPKMNGAALPMSSEYLQLVSEHQWECGLRFHPKYQKKEWFPPASGDAHWLTSPGLWLPKGTKRPEIDKKVNMVTVLEAMRKVDEGDFLAAVESVANAREKK